MGSGDPQGSFREFQGVPSLMIVRNQMDPCGYVTRAGSTDHLVANSRPIENNGELACSTHLHMVARFGSTRRLSHCLLVMVLFAYLFFFFNRLKESLGSGFAV